MLLFCTVSPESRLASFSVARARRHNVFFDRGRCFYSQTPGTFCRTNNIILLYIIILLIFVLLCQSPSYLFGPDVRTTQFLLYTYCFAVYEVSFGGVFFSYASYYAYPAKGREIKCSWGVLWKLKISYVVQSCFRQILGQDTRLIWKNKQWFSCLIVSRYLCVFIMFKTFWKI